MFVLSFICNRYVLGFRFWCLVGCLLLLFVVHLVFAVSWCVVVLNFVVCLIVATWVFVDLVVLVVVYCGLFDLELRWVCLFIDVGLLLCCCRRGLRLLVLIWIILVGLFAWGLMCYLVLLPVCLTWFIAWLL